MSEPGTAPRRARLRIVQIEPRFAEQLAQLQRDCFPNLAVHEWLTRENFLSHCRIFPEGGFVAVDDTAERERVVGLGSGFFTDFDFDHPNHTFKEIIAGGDYTNHDPNGEWYYGADISVHPDYRGRGIGRMLYDARKELVRRFERRGIVAGGALPGYQRYKGRMTVAEYVERVVAGELSDPTLTFQLRNGFEVQGMIEGYIEDEYTGNWASLIVWLNPEYR